jgi:hypothetical protein
MGFTNTELDASLDALASRWVYASIHTANPSTTGANEVTGGSPAYARQLVDWDPATGQILAMDAPLEFNMPAGSTAAYVGIWSAVTAGTFRGSDQLSSSESFTGQGTYELTALTVTATTS